MALLCHIPVGFGHQASLEGGGYGRRTKSDVPWYMQLTNQLGNTCPLRFGQDILGTEGSTGVGGTRASHV